MRVYNFSAGPSMLPLEVLEQVRTELTDWQGSGMSVMEVSHRSGAFEAMAAAAEADLRELLAIPAEYRVLFMQGGGYGQFAAVPLNLAGGGAASYVDSGHWASKAIEEARRFTDVEVVAEAASAQFRRLPPIAQWRSASGRYLHVTLNETINGLEFADPPVIPGLAVPLVADASSTLLSRPLDVRRFGCLYAGAQKNIGPAGLTLVIVHEGLLDRADAHTPQVLHYAALARAGSMLNTPPTFAWYVAGLVFAWLRRQGGLAAMGQRNRAKAELLYRTIDGSGFYVNRIDPAWRSWMNIPFDLARAELNEAFLAEAEREGLTNLRGHRAVGGMRASLYNAMPMEGVQVLVDFMREVARRHH